MTPTFSRMNIVDGGGAFQVKSVGQLLVCGPVAFRYRANQTDVTYIILRKDGSWIKRAYLFCKAIFGNTVANVLRVCAQKKMSYIHTGRVVAGVANLKTVWYWAMSKFPRKSVRGFIYGADADIPVPIRVGGRSPNPTFSKFWMAFGQWAVFVHLFPKAIFKRAIRRAAGWLKMIRVYTKFITACHEQASEWWKRFFSDDNPCRLTTAYSLFLVKNKFFAFRSPNKAVTICRPVYFFPKTLFGSFSCGHAAF